MRELGYMPKQEKAEEVARGRSLANRDCVGQVSILRPYRLDHKGYKDAPAKILVGFRVQQTVTRSDPEDSRPRVDTEPEARDDHATEDDKLATPVSERGAGSDCEGGMNGCTDDTVD